MLEHKKTNFFIGLALMIFISSVLLVNPTPTLALDSGETLMGSILEIAGGDVLMCTPDVDADDAQLELQSGGGTKLLPQVDDLIFADNIDFDLEESQMLQYGMDTSQYDNEAFINDTVSTGVVVEEAAKDDPTETVAFSIGSDYGYGKTTCPSESDGDTYSGYYYETIFFDDEDNDGVKDDAENAFLSDFDENCYIYIGAKGDWSNISTTAGDDVVEISIYFTTSGTDLEIEAKITADADGNTGWSNFDDGSADNKATFMYANADAQFVAFYFDLSLMNNYDEDDYSTIKGLKKIRYQILAMGADSTGEIWVYNVAFIKKPTDWNYGSYDRPAITESGTHDIPKTFIPSYTAASESDGGMYLNYATLDVPVSTVTEASDVTSAYVNLINTDEQLRDGDVLPLNWRKVKFESDQSGTNKEDDYNLQLLPIDSGEYAYKAEVVRNHPDGGVEVRETFYFDFSGMDDIDTSSYLLTWDTSTDKIYLEDEIEYDNMARDVKTSKDPSDLVVSATEGLADTFDATQYLSSDWSGEADEAFIQYTLNKQPSTTTGDILKHVRNVRYNGDWDKIKGLTPAVDGPIWQEKTTLIFVGGGLIGLATIIIGALVYRGRKKSGGRGRR